MSAARVSRGLAALLALLLPLALFSCGDSSGVSEDASPDCIVVFTLDTLRADHLGCYGYFRDTSPHIDRFAEQAVLFENATTPVSSTLPAHVSLWTSLHPIESGIQSNQIRFELPADGSTSLFAAELQERGWATAAFVSATPVKRESGIAVGFDFFDQPGVESRQRTADVVTRRALEWLERPPERPWFLWLHYFDPHTPHAAPIEYQTFRSNEPELIRFLQERAFASDHVARAQGWHNAYDAEIRFMDAQIERVLERLRELGVWERATVVMVGDHGEGLGQHGVWKHGRLHNEQLFVPLILKLPERLGIAPGRRSELVSLLDIVPTLVQSLELPVSEAFASQLSGQSLLEPPGDRKSLLVQRPAEKMEAGGNWDVEFGLLSEDWKLHLSETVGARLYDMRSDPHELVDVSGENRELAARMERELRERIGRLSIDGQRLKSFDDLDEETRRQLEALGYVGKQD
jgi:arylsulfatase